MIANLTELSPQEWKKPAGFLQRVILIAPLLMVAGLLVAKAIAPWWYWHIFVREDGPGEWLTAIVYLAAAPLAGLLSIRFLRQGLSLHALLAAVLALGLFFVGMEEISWGQRLFGFATPDALAGVNRQQELNLHNLGENPLWLDLGFIGVSGFALSAFYWLPTVVDMIFGGRFRSIAQLISPPPILAFYFAPLFLLYCYYVLNPQLVSLFGPGWEFAYSPEEGLFMLARDQEPAECIMAIGFALFVIWLLILERAGVWSSQAQAAREASAS